MRGDYARVTAAERPGVAQPVPVRPVPAQPWGRILLGAVLLLALLVAGWEAYWRAYGVKPGFANAYGLWAIQRRRIDQGEGDATVVICDSRLFFDMQLPVWERLDGRRPIQLGLEGTSPAIFLEDLAADPKFTGRLLVGIAPQVFFRRQRLSRRRAQVLPQGVAVAAHRPVAVHAPDRALFRLRRLRFRARYRAQAPAVARAARQELAHGGSQARRHRSGPQHLLVGQG